MVQKVTTSTNIWTIKIWIQHPAWSSWKDTQEARIPTNRLYGQVSFADQQFHPVSHVLTKKWSISRFTRIVSRPSAVCVFSELYMFWDTGTVLFSAQISSQKHTTDPREERRSEKTQGATCNPSTETWMVNHSVTQKLLCFLGPNQVLIVPCMSPQLQKLWLWPYEVSSGWHAAVCVGVRDHQALKCVSCRRSETSFTDSYKPTTQWPHLHRQQVEYTEPEPTSNLIWNRRVQHTIHTPRVCMLINLYAGSVNLSGLLF